VRLHSRRFELGAEDGRALRDLASREGLLLEREGSCVCGFGLAESLRLPDGLADGEATDEVQERLLSLSRDGALPLLIGALPFRPDEPGELSLPEVAVQLENERWRAVVTAGTDHPERLAGLLQRARRKEGPPPEPPDCFQLESARPHAEFRLMVERAVEEIRSGRFDKVVLARQVTISANRPFAKADLIERLRSLHPSCLTFSVDGFIGASPELLVRQHGLEVSSHPLAGTAARSGDPEADAKAAGRLFGSQKDRAEHRAVVEAIASALGPITTKLTVPEHPEIVSLRNVSHLGTFISGELAGGSGGRYPSALSSLALIHPTPAVCGTPTEEALEYIAKEEGLDRGRYAGPLGWVRADGDGEFHLGIRSAVLEGSKASLYAGVGIVADSEPAEELRETQLKLQAMLAALVRP
jgi:menaquinone-specific isochorismate synthase